MGARRRKGIGFFLISFLLIFVFNFLFFILFDDLPRVEIADENDFEEGYYSASCQFVIESILYYNKFIIEINSQNHDTIMNIYIYRSGELLLRESHYLPYKLDFSKRIIDSYKIIIDFNSGNFKDNSISIQSYSSFNIVISALINLLLFILIISSIIYSFSKTKEEKDKEKEEFELKREEDRRIMEKEWEATEKERLKQEREKQLKEIEEYEKKKENIIIKARNYELAERFNEAISIYEEYEMWKDAGRVRKKQREILIEKKEIITKHIHINANKLFDQIKKEGLAVPYKCPNCSGAIKITGKKIDTCPYCGSDLDLETLSDLVKTMLE